MFVVAWLGVRLLFDSPSLIVQTVSDTNLAHSGWVSRTETVMFTTKVTLRFAAGLPRASTRIPIAFGSVTTSRQSVIRPFLIARRTFATPGRPKKGSVGESSPRARKTVKKDATTKPSNKAVKTTSKTSTTKKPSATAEKKAAASKARVAREQARKAKEREKAAAKKLREKQRADKKKAATKKPKKVLTPEQKAAATAKLAKSNLAALKKQALSPPPITKGTAWVVYFSEKAKELKGSLAGGSVIDKMGAKVKEAAAEYKNLSPADMEVCVHVLGDSIKLNDYSTTTILQTRQKPSPKPTIVHGYYRTRQTRSDLPMPLVAN